MEKCWIYYNAKSVNTLWGKAHVLYSPFVDTGNTAELHVMTSVGWSVLNVGLILAIDDNLPSVSLAFWPQVSCKMNAE